MNRTLRRLVWRRAAGRCEYCRMPHALDDLDFEIDHIQPQQHEGPTEPNNLALACFACNHHKGPNLSGIDPNSRRITRLFHPRRHSWHRHFQWREPFLIGLTPIGRATIHVLKINLPHRVNLRQELMNEGAFPA